MKMRSLTILTFILFIGLTLGACAPAATPTQAPTEPPPLPTATEVVEPTAVPTQEVVVVEPEPVEPADADELDPAYEEFLAEMVAYNTIGLDGLNEMMAEDPPFLLDVRSPAEVEEQGYIEGSVLIPLRELGDNLAQLPEFDEPIVSYCGSGWRCTIAMTALGAMGWEDVKGLKGGSFSGWIEAGYPIAEGLPPEGEALALAEPAPAMEVLFDEVLTEIPEGWGGITADQLATEIVENPDLILIDVRRQEEVDEKGMIDAPNVIHIPLEEFVERSDEWPTDLDAPIVVYCGSGHRSTMAMTILWSYGYEDVRSLKGGFGGWAEAGYPAVGGAPDLDSAYNAFLADMVAYNTIGLEGFNTMLAENPDVFILDVRQPTELEEKGHIEGAVHIPLREVGANTAYLPSFDTPIVSYCGSGWRCTIAMTALGALGYEDILSLKGGSYGGWVEAGYPTVEGAAPEAVAIDVASPDPALLAVIDETFANVPEGYGVITAENLAAEIVENPDLILIDVRRQEEVEEKGVIDAPNVIHIPLEEFVERSAEWPTDLDAPIVIYCGSGHRSTMAMTILWSYGYEDVHSLKGGFGGWAEAGYPVATYEEAMAS